MVELLLPYLIDVLANIVKEYGVFDNCPFTESMLECFTFFNPIFNEEECNKYCEIPSLTNEKNLLVNCAIFSSHRIALFFRSSAAKTNMMFINLVWYDTILSDLVQFCNARSNMYPKLFGLSLAVQSLASTVDVESLGNLICTSGLENLELSFPKDETMQLLQYFCNHQHSIKSLIIKRELFLLVPYDHSSDYSLEFFQLANLLITKNDLTLFGLKNFLFDSKDIEALFSTDNNNNNKLKRLSLNECHIEDPQTFFRLVRNFTLDRLDLCSSLRGFSNEFFTFMDGTETKILDLRNNIRRSKPYHFNDLCNLKSRLKLLLNRSSISFINRNDKITRDEFLAKLAQHHDVDYNNELFCM
jgi:hypothetical protein